MTAASAAAAPGSGHGRRTAGLRAALALAAAVVLAVTETYEVAALLLATNVACYAACTAALRGVRRRYLTP